MDAVILKRAESDHKQRQKLVPPLAKKKLDPTGLPRAVAGTKYYSGWVLAGLPTSKRMLTAGLLVKVFTADFYHTRGTAHGSYAFIVGQDANNHIIVLAAMHTIFAESKATWVQLIEPTLAYYGQNLLDTVDCVHISDADKGAASAYRNLLNFAQTFICRQYRGDTVGGKFGKGAKQLYLDYVNALTQTALVNARAKMSQTMRAYALFSFRSPFLRSLFICLSRARHSTAREL